MIYSVFDIESDGLLDSATKIHCLSYQKFDKDVLIEADSLTEYEDIVNFVMNEDILIGHKIITYDVPLLEKMFDIKITARLIDTLGISWYLYPDRLIHGLDEWGYEFGIAKPVILNWNDLPVSDYIYRCSEDVRINVRLWQEELKYLKKIYVDSPVNMDRFLGYISFKLDCAREQEDRKWKLDIPKCETNLKIFLDLYDEKVINLSSIMPKHTTYKIKEKPKKMYKKDETVSELGRKWLELLKEMNLPEYHNGALKLVDKVEDGNPGSHQQLKGWLFSLGWEPITFKYVKDKNTPYDKETPPRKVPQLQSDDDTGLCESVKLLFEKEPRLEELEDLFLIRNRISVIKGFLESVDKNGFVQAEINGFTNTMRMQHRKPIANLPGIPKKYWEMIRECLIARDDEHILCGSDMSSLEDSTKRHYMYYYDPVYVKEMMAEGFDPHLDIAIRTKLLIEDDVSFYKTFNKDSNNSLQAKRYSTIKGTRLKAKKTNFAAVYGAGPAKIALTANVPLEEGRLFHKAYWERNWSVKEVSNNTVVRVMFKDGTTRDFKGKDVLSQKADVTNRFMLKVQSIWLYNPISQFYYSLRYFKDIFSTLNQGTGVYCFDMWVKECRRQNYVICMQYHDEHVGDILKTEQDRTREILATAINIVNDKLKLNIKLGISIDFGNSYKDIH